jgi:polysaccharide biosynthesis protein PslH
MTQTLSPSGTRLSGDGLRVLFVAPYVPSPIRVRPYQILRSLVSAGNRVSLVALDDGLAGESVRAELSELCESVDIVPVPKAAMAVRCALALPTPTPLWAAYGRVPKMARVLQYRVSSERFDVAHVEHLRASHVARFLGSLPRVFDAVDCIAALQSQLFRQPGALRGRLVAWEEWSKLRRFEPRAYKNFDRVAVTSAFDAKELASLGLPDAVVIPNGVDVESLPKIPRRRRRLWFSAAK